MSCKYGTSELKFGMSLISTAQSIKRSVPLQARACRYATPGVDLDSVAGSDVMRIRIFDGKEQRLGEIRTRVD